MFVTIAFIRANKMCFDSGQSGICRMFIWDIITVCIVFKQPLPLGLTKLSTTAQP